MSQRPLSVDETILALLQAREVLASADLASALGIHERSVRRHLRRLVRGGYVFSPEHGRYRITASGAAAMAPIETPPCQVQSRPRSGRYPWRNRPE